MPTLAIAKTVGADLKMNYNKWTLILGSGPRGENGLKGESDQPARVIYLGGTLPTGHADILGNGLVDANNKPQRALRISKL